MEGFSRDFLCGIGKGASPPPEQKLGQLGEEMEEEVDVGLTLGGRERKGDKLPRSSSLSAMPASGTSPSAASREGTLMRTGSLPAVNMAAINDEWKKRLPPKYPASITSQDNLSALAKKPNSALQAVTVEPGSSSSVLSSGEAISIVMAASPLLPSTLAPRTAVTLASMADQTILGRAAERANSMGDVERRIMQAMPGVYTQGLPNGNRVEGFLYKYRNGEDVEIVCICHGNFLTPSEFVEHAGAGRVENPLRYIVVSPTPTTL